MEKSLYLNFFCFSAVVLSKHTKSWGIFNKLQHLAVLYFSLKVR